jgi:hypothetical protein
MSAFLQSGRKQAVVGAYFLFRLKQDITLGIIPAF